ncbi:MAG: YeeE/YedE family protein [Phaeodactylibacter sp.]|nr:YeeE/YedE family protein [Phaeodactylibacter sp.]MCB9301373.1 YeeE/YedE family protein [Lewinellaceae bacterium]
MKHISFFTVGIFFGIVMTKSEAISWFRIQEMFRFESFHMYGIIGTAVVLGAIAIWIMKKVQMKTLRGATVDYTPMKFNIKRHLLAGTIFGLGWAITGCCPGPMYILIGNGYFIIALVMLGAILGTYVYGRVMDKLPH